MISKRPLAIVFPIVLGANLAACGSVTIVEPPNGVRINTAAGVNSAKVNFKVEIGADNGTHSILLRKNSGTPDTRFPMPLTSVLTKTIGSNAPDSYGGSVTLDAADYSINATGEARQWDGSRRALSATSSFTVVGTARTPSLTLAVSPSPVLVARKGSVTMNYALTGANLTQSQASVTASNLPSGVSVPQAPVTFSGGATMASATAVLTASATASGSTTARFMPAMSGVNTSDVSVPVTVTAAPGPLIFLPAPFLGQFGPTVTTSVDGRFTTSFTRMGASRVWTATITNNTNGKSMQVNFAIKGGAGGSNLGGVTFCPGNPTTTALVFSDNDENPNPQPSPATYNYKAKIVLLESLREGGSVEDFNYENGVIPQLGFSTDCSLVAAWGASPGLAAIERVLRVKDAFANYRVLDWSYQDAQLTRRVSANVIGNTLTATAPNSQQRSVAITP